MHLMNLVMAACVRMPMWQTILATYVYCKYKIAGVYLVLIHDGAILWLEISKLGAYSGREELFTFVIIYTYSN